jgi:protein phosphatase
MSAMILGKPSLHLCALTHAGLVRPHNEDAHALCANINTAVLADGLGGGQAGEIASAMAVHLLAESLESQWQPTFSPAVSPQDVESQILQREQTLRGAVSLANRTILLHSQSDERYSGMGTTMVLANWLGPHLLVGHVGDSRAYIFRASRWNVGARVHHHFKLQALTRDHSTAQRAAESRLAMQPSLQETRSCEAVPRLTRALGMEAEVVLELHRHTVNPGDVVLLCSDGLTDMLSEAEIEAIFQKAIGPDGATVDRLSTAAQALMQAALDAGGHDNITAVLGLQDAAPLQGDSSIT